jgi:predicted ATP-grasp superfamily ATP-dependent carboligase
MPPFTDWIKQIRNLVIPGTTIVLVTNIPSDTKGFDVVIGFNNRIKATAGSIIVGESIILNDKLLFANYVATKGLQHLVPKLYTPEDAEFPCISKKRIGCGGSGSTIYHNKKELDRFRSTSEYIFQEYIHGSDEYSAHGFVLDGILKWVTYYHIKYIQPFHIHRTRMSQYDVVMLDYRKEIQELLVGYTGFICVDFKIDVEGIKIFEINPRFGGTIVHSDDFVKLVTCAIESLVEK